VHEAIRDGILLYAQGLDTLKRQLYPLAPRGRART
jgi:hypothetical protein